MLLGNRFSRKLIGFGEESSDGSKVPELRSLNRKNLPGAHTSTHSQFWAGGALGSYSRFPIRALSL